MLSLAPAYIPLIQKPTCCAVTCLQMILYRNGYGLFDQEKLAVHFGVKIAAEDARAFRADMPTMTQQNFDEGIQTVELVAPINAFFAAHTPGLTARRVRAGSVGKLDDFLRENLANNRDIWIEYHGHEIYGWDLYKGDYIHDSLIESFDPARAEATIVDPLPQHRQRELFPLAMMERAISKRFGRETGFIVVEKS
jgi:hypothetical protein